MTNELIYVPYHTYIVFAIGLIVYTFTFLLIKGNLFNLYSSNDFPSKEYYEFWKNMTSEQRLFLTETYYKFYIDFRQRILDIQSSNKNTKIDIEAKFLNSTHLSLMMQYENVPFVLVSLIPKNKTDIKKKLLVCSHFDGHNLTDGGTAYDDAIHTVTMLGVIDAISRKDIELNTQVDFLFDGAEEFGLVGAYQYANYLKENNITENYDYLNLESMGGNTPYVFVIKNDFGNYRIQKTLSKVRGTILIAQNYIVASGAIGSTTDHEVFNAQNWTGGVNVFLGHASVYHTKYDKIVKEDHLNIAGCQLLDFVLKYETEDDSYNGNSFGYGIAPMCVVLPSLVIYILNPIIFVAAVVLIVLKERKIWKEFLFDLLFEFISFIIILIIYVIIGLFVHLANPFSAAPDQTFIYLTSIMGLFLFLIFQRIFKIKKWSRFRLILDLILMMVCIKTDLALPLLTLTILSTVFYFLDYKISKYISAFFQYLVMSLLFAFLLQLGLQFSPRLGNSILGNMLDFILFFIFSYHMSASPLDLYDVTEEKKITGLMKNFFSKDINLDNEVIGGLIKDDLIDGESKISIKSGKEVNKYFNRKVVAIYLLFFYILYIIVLILVLFLIPYPYSKTFTFPGQFKNIYTDYENSTMTFMPYITGNYPKKNIEQSGYVFKELTEDKNLYYAVKSKEPINNNNPQCVFTMPPLEDFFEINHVRNISDTEYELNIKINISKTTCIEAVYINFYCETCLQQMNGKIANEKYYKDIRLIIKHGKKEIVDSELSDFITETNIIVNVTSFNYTVQLNTKRTSKDYLKFLESFGEASVNFASPAISDTIDKYDGVFNL